MKDVLLTGALIVAVAFIGVPLAAILLYGWMRWTIWILEWVFPPR